MNFRARPISYIGAFVACAVMSLATGCASGGFKLTRTYAQFVNSQNIIIRIILYILTGIVFAVTILIDLVINNTMDFWDGRVSAGDYQFKQDGKTYLAHHELLPGSGLRKSTIRVLDDKDHQLQEVVLSETSAGDIEVRVDGRLRGRVHGISEIPIASIYGSDGSWIEDRVLPIGITAQASTPAVF